MTSCCSTRSQSPHVPANRRGARVAAFLLSSATLVLMPKCPMCLAAYVTVATGVGLSVTTAAHLRLGVLAVCVSVVTALTLQVIWRRRRLARA